VQLFVNVGSYLHASILAERNVHC